MKSRKWITLIALFLCSCISAAQPEAPEAHYFLPDAAASKFVSVERDTTPSASVTILTQAVAIKETGPAETVKTFGEVYSFSPNFIVVACNRPTQFEFWNLQSDDVHQFFLLSPESQALMFLKLLPLIKTSYVFTFHKKGVYTFQCPMHGKAMWGQILVQ